MTHWGFGLLAVYVALGLSRTSWRKAGRIATLATAGIVAYALHTYGAI
jgi:hypothetical protein